MASSPMFNASKSTQAISVRHTSSQNPKSWGERFKGIQAQFLSSPICYLHYCPRIYHNAMHVCDCGIRIMLACRHCNPAEEDYLPASTSADKKTCRRWGRNRQAVWYLLWTCELLYCQPSPLWSLSHACPMQRKLTWLRHQIKAVQQMVDYRKWDQVTQNFD